MIDKAVLEQIKPGAQVKVHETIGDGSSKKSSGQTLRSDSGQAKSRTSVFSGLVLARKHGSEVGATFTVRATIAGEGVEKIYPIHSPRITKIEIISSPKKVRRAKLYYIRNLSKKEIRQKVGV